MIVVNPEVKAELVALWIVKPVSVPVAAHVSVTWSVVAPAVLAATAVNPVGTAGATGGGTVTGAEYAETSAPLTACIR